MLLGFGYEISMADGSIAPQEQKYLQAIAKCLNVATQHLAVLEAGMSNQDVDPTALDAVHNLLDPTRFQSLDPIFANAANTIRARTVGMQVLDTLKLSSSQWTMRQTVDSLTPQLLASGSKCDPLANPPTPPAPDPQAPALA